MGEDRLFDILYFLGPEGFVLEGEFCPNRTTYRFRDADTARFRQALQARRDIDPVAVNVTVLDHVTKIHPHAKHDALIIGPVLAALLQLMLGFYRTRKRVTRRIETRQNGIAGIVHDFTAVFVNSSGNEVETIAEPAVGRILILPGEFTVACNVGIENGG